MASLRSGASEQSPPLRPGLGRAHAISAIQAPVRSLSAAALGRIPGRGTPRLTRDRSRRPPLDSAHGPRGLSDKHHAAAARRSSPSAMSDRQAMLPAGCIFSASTPIRGFLLAVRIRLRVVGHASRRRPASPRASPGDKTTSSRVLEPHPTHGEREREAAAELARRLRAPGPAWKSTRRAAPARAELLACLFKVSVALFAALAFLLRRP